MGSLEWSREDQPWAATPEAAQWSGSRGRVLFIGDLATSALMLSPVLEVLEQDYPVQAMGVTFRDAVRRPKMLAERSRGAHVLGHGAASLAIERANLEGIRSLTMIAGLEPQPIPRFSTGQLSVLSGFDTGEDVLTFEYAVQFLDKLTEYIRAPLLHTRLLRSIARISSLEVLSQIRQAQDIPGLYVPMEHDELGRLSLEQTARALEFDVNWCEITGPKATHDLLLRDPEFTLTQSNFEQQLG